MRYDSQRRFQVSYQPGRSNEEACIVVYDVECERIDDLTLYAYKLSKIDMLDEKSILQTIYDLRIAKEYLLQFSKSHLVVNGEKSRIFDPSPISDGLLTSFRDWRLEMTRAKTKQLSLQTAKRTVNASLKVIYSWLWWLRLSGRADDYLIGAFPCRVISEGGFDQLKVGNAASQMKERHSAPLCFKRVNDNSRHKVPGFVPTEDTRLDLFERFASESGEGTYLTERNKLFLNIVNFVGLRRESVNSLQTCQFSRSDIDAVVRKGGGFYSVKPIKQKYSREKWYQFPVWLAYQISDFVDKDRSIELKNRGWRDDTTRNAIFLSARDGKPLRDRTLTKIFSSAMRASGAPKRSSVHAWRHKFVGEAIEDEIIYRLDRGLDTSAHSIMEAVSLETGHRNPESLHAYVVSQIAKNKKPRG